MSSSVAGLLAVGIPAVLIAGAGVVVARTAPGAFPQLARRVPLGWRLLGGFAPSLFLVGVLALYVWFRGLLGLQQHTTSGSWTVLVIGLVLTLGSIVGYTGSLRRRRAAGRSML